jgi:SAM-dependent methyltransferase
VLGPASSHPREPVHTSLVGLRLERSIDECLRRDVAPLPTPEDRGGYHGQRHFDFWLSGLADHLRIIDAAARVGVTLAAGDRVLDFGCGSGRVLRHFLAQRPELEAWGVDANPAAVEWIASNLSPAAKVFRTTTFPHLPLPDASFKVAFALAVFSHLDELDIAQLLELRRCLVPGGIAYVSVQTDATWARLDESNPAFRLVQAARDAHPDLDLSPEALRAGMPGERLVFPGPAGHAPCVFRSERFIRETWGRFFEVCEIISRGCAAEDVVVLRRPLEGVAAAATPAPSKAVPVAAVPVAAATPVPTPAGEPSEIEVKAAIDTLKRVGFRRVQKAGWHFQVNNFYSACNDVEFLDANRDLWLKRGVPAGVDWNIEGQLAVAAEIGGHVDELRDIPQESSDPSVYAWKNPFFNNADALAYYGMIRSRKPARVIEIGCGWSSLLLAKAVLANDAQTGRRTEVTQVEPYPRKNVLKALPSHWKLHESILQRAPLELFETLQAGDVLFYDGSHVSKAASDVNWFFFEVLPRVARGVIIHVHDIFFPNDYPEDWIMNRGQTWNEQYILHALLAGGSNYRIEICNAMLGHLRRQDVEKLYKGVQPAYGCSIWLRKA